MTKLNLQSPWITYVNEVRALFAKDPEVSVEYEDGDAKRLSLFVTSQEKADALTQIMPQKVEFGNVILEIEVVPANEEAPSKAELFFAAFKGNQAVAYTDSVEAMGFSANYIVFKPEIVQFFNDDLGDINGNMTTIYENVANDVFEGHEGVFFCTDAI